MVEINLLLMFTMKINILSLQQLLEKGYDILIICSLSIRDSLGNLIVKVPMIRNWTFVLKIRIDVAKSMKNYIGDSN